MPVCKNCETKFPCKVTINGREYHSPKRKYCYECNPVGTRNFWGNKRVSGNPRKTKKRRFVCAGCNKEVYQKTNGRFCVTCKSKKYRIKKKLKAIEFLGGKCEECGYDKCVKALDFHHKNKDEKSFGLSNNWTKPWEVIEKELKKCSLLCCRCHTELHYL